MADQLPSYEILGKFYLGKKYDLATRTLSDEKVLYDSKDLTTHALCVGMTGSGKTGLCLALLEEAAIDRIPAIAIDPKGDLGNLLLAFPKLAPYDFKPWLEQSEADQKGISLDQLAAQTADKWRSGLESWEQDSDRITRYREAVDIAVYTPGSNAGIPLTVLKSFDAPPAEVLGDLDLMRERVSGAASGLLTLLGMEVDPLTSREHILLSTIFNQVWSQGKNIDLGSLIRFIQSPPVAKVGVFDLESFFPTADRMKLAMSLNNLLASPAFAGWLEGQPLDIKSLLYGGSGKPRLSIISIAHLSDSERMFFVTMLLNELIAWMRTQPGTGSLRALFYMDEVFGYFPPSAKPPSKPPMLMLLKQARAFGLGIALATQNPVDLDYKGLSNIGTWFLGRLQTGRDKDRVLEGLEGAAIQSGTKFDRAAMEQTLAALGNRVFLMNNVHEDAPTIFQSRWALSFLRGPLSRVQIQKLMDPVKAMIKGSPVQSAASSASQSNTGATASPVASVPPVASASPTQTPVTATVIQSTQDTRPILPADVVERFCLADHAAPVGAELVYRPAVMGLAACHYVKASASIDCWIDKAFLYDAAGGVPDELWDGAVSFDPKQLTLDKNPEEGFQFDTLPDELIAAKRYKSWQTQLKDFLYRHETLKIFECPELKAFSRPGQDELDARMAWTQQVRERRDAEVAKLRSKYETQLRAIESKIATAQQRVDREKAQYDEAKVKSILDIGTTVLGALLGNKRSSVLSRSSTSARTLGKAATQRSDVFSASETLDHLLLDRRDLVEKCEEEVRQLQSQFSVETLTLDACDIPCRKSDIRVDCVGLVWMPYARDNAGRLQPLAGPKPT
ncbi:MAG: ATP-binding protein [Pirellulales bacterium]